MIASDTFETRERGSGTAPVTLVKARRTDGKGVRVIVPPSFAPVSRLHWARVLMVLLGVPALAIGLLAMHAFTTDTGVGTDAVQVATAAAAMPAMSTPVSAPVSAVEQLAAMAASTGVSASGACSGLCDPDHEMLGSACVLALLITVLLFALHLVLASRKEPRRGVPAVVARMVTLAAVAPPSLHVLSISRT